MYISRVRLNPRRESTKAALHCPSKFHGAVERCFGEYGKRKLWRIDQTYGGTSMLIVSAEDPDLTPLSVQFGFPGDTGETKLYDGFLDSIKKGSTWHFRLVANPTEMKSGDHKVVACGTEEKQIEWMLKRAEKNGFHFADKDGHADVYLTAWRFMDFMKKGKYQIRMVAVAYEGTLVVDDPALFTNLLVNGIGREKAYGMGLMTIAAF